MKKRSEWKPLRRKHKQLWAFLLELQKVANKKKVVLFIRNWSCVDSSWNSHIHCGRPLSHSPCNHVRAYSDVCVEVCDWVQGFPIVWLVVDGDEWSLWLLPWLCHPFVCFFANHHITTHHIFPHSIAEVYVDAMRPGDMPSCIDWVYGDRSSNAFSDNFFPFFLLFTTALSSSVHFPLSLTWKTGSGRIWLLLQVHHHQSSYSDGWWWRALQFCDISIQPFHCLSLFVWFYWICKEYVVMSSIIVVKNECCLKSYA